MNLKRAFFLFAYISLLLIGGINLLTFNSCQIPNANDSTQTPLGTVISGKVFDTRGFPFMDVKVHSSAANYTQTLADGSFTLTNITYPVTLFLKRDIDSTPNVYIGLNSNNPQLTYNTYGDNSNFNSGQFRISYPAVPLGKGLLIKFTCEDIVDFNYTFMESDSISATVPITWQGDKSTVLGKLILMTYTRNSFNRISAYNTYAEKTFYVDANRIIDARFTAADFSTPDNAVINVRNGNFSATCDVNSYFSLAGNINSDMFLEHINQVGEFDFVVPKVFSSNRIRISTHAPYEDDAYVENNIFTQENSIVTFNGINKIGFANPLLNAVDVDSTTLFKVIPNSTPIGIFLYSFEPVGNFYRKVWIYNTSEQFTYPDLSQYGYNLARGKEYKWAVQKIAPFGNLDDYFSAASNKLIRNYNIQANSSYFTTLP